MQNHTFWSALAKQHIDWQLQSTCDLWPYAETIGFNLTMGAVLYRA